MEVNAGLHWQSYNLMWGSEDEVDYFSPVKRHFSLSGGAQIEEKFEVHFVYSKEQPPSVRMNFASCECSFKLTGPTYNEYGLEFRYVPFRKNSPSPYVAFKYALNLLTKNWTGKAYVDSLHGYRYVVGNHGPRTRPLNIPGFQSVALILGSNVDVNSFLSVIMRVSGTATASESPIQIVQFTLQSTSHRIQDVIYHAGLQFGFSVGIRIDLSEIKTSANNDY